MATVNADIAHEIAESLSCKCASPHLGFERRVKQLLAQRNDVRRQAEYMQQVVSRMIPLLPKEVVSHILKTAKQSSQPTTKGETHVRLQKHFR